MLTDTHTRSRTDSAASISGPPELLPGCPDAVIDLQTEAGVELVGGGVALLGRPRRGDRVRRGRSPGRTRSGPGLAPNRTFDVLPHAELAGYDDSEWRVLEPADTQLRLSQGRVCFNWYRTAVTLPERVGDFDPTGGRRGVRSGDRRLRRGLGGTAHCRTRSATREARSSPASTHPIGDADG